MGAGGEAQVCAGPHTCRGTSGKSSPHGAPPPPWQSGKASGPVYTASAEQPSQGWCALWGVDAFPRRARLLVRWRNSALSVCEQMACLPAGHSGLSLPAGRRPFSLSLSHAPPASPRSEASSLPPTPTDQPSKIRKHASVRRGANHHTEHQRMRDATRAGGGQRFPDPPATSSSHAKESGGLSNNHPSGSYHDVPRTELSRSLRLSAVKPLRLPGQAVLVGLHTEKRKAQRG